MKKGFLLLIMAVMLTLPSLAAAQAKSELVLKLTAQKEVTVKDADGKIRIEWHAAEKTNPGDVLKYTIAYTNTGKVEARNAVINDPVPEGTTYIANSAEGKNTEISFSIDGKKFEAPTMLTYKVKQPDGTVTEHRAGPEMYTHIRWKVMKPVNPGESGTVSFKVTVK